jgi:alkylation response protein AidB-like acyl-CoA dehydrogenase
MKALDCGRLRVGALCLGMARGALEACEQFAHERDELIFENCRVPKENVIGEVGLGFITFMKTLDVGRLSPGAACLGEA